MAENHVRATVAPTHVVDTPYKWKSVAVIAGGFISGIDFHPGQKDLAYVRTDIGGAYRWDATTQRWVPLLDWLTAEDWNFYGIESIGLDPSNPQKLYLACGTYTNDWGGNGAILRSDNQGRSFARTDMPFKFGGNEDGRSIGERLAVDPNDGSILFLGTRNNGLWSSRDAGVTWSQVSSFPITGRTNGIGTGVVVFDPRSGKKGQPTNTIYVSEAERGKGLYRSEDGGSTWSLVPGQPAGLYPHHMLMTSTGLLVITYSDGPGPNGISNGAVWTYLPRTQAWSDITPIKPNVGGEQGFGYAGLSIDPFHPKTMVVTTLDRWSKGDDVFRTVDGGLSWTAYRKGSVLDASAAPYMKWGKDAASFGWWLGAVGLDPYDSSRVLYGTGANIWGSDDTALGASTGVSHWSIRGLGIEETADIDLLSPATGPHLITALGDIGGFTHEDLDKPAPGMTLNPILGNVDCLAEASDSPAWIVRVGRGSADQPQGGYSQDAGLTWTQFGSSPVPRKGGGSIAISGDASVFVWAPDGGIPYRSTDHGSTWAASVGAPSRAQILADGAANGVFYAVARDGVYSSSDSGGSFAKQDSLGLPGRMDRARMAPGRKGDMWIPSSNGLYRSRNGGRSFAAVVGVDSASSVGFGKAAPGHDFHAIYLNGKVDGASGVFRSDDEGGTWRRITDSTHEYGVRNTVIGDSRIYGRVYLGTNGRGVLYADPARP
jgi:photosystem II stability/assembly factor-like uncharacterized protein